jgi:hypothetical protein
MIALILNAWVRILVSVFAPNFCYTIRMLI